MSGRQDGKDKERSGTRPGNPLSPRQRTSDKVWRKGPLTVVERAVAEVIARHMNPDGVAFPGYRRIAECAGICEKSAQNAMKVLVNGDAERGVLPLFTRTPRGGAAGKARGFLYRFVENPEALVKARAANAEKVGAIEAVLVGRVRSSGIRVGEREKAEAQELRLQELRLQKVLLEGQLSQSDYETRVAAIRKRLIKLSREVARVGTGMDTDDGDRRADHSPDGQ